MPRLTRETVWFGRSPVRPVVPATATTVTARRTHTLYHWAPTIAWISISSASASASEKSSPLCTLAAAARLALVQPPSIASRLTVHLRPRQPTPPLPAGLDSLSSRRRWRGHRPMMSPAIPAQTPCVGWRPKAASVRLHGDTLCTSVHWCGPYNGIARGALRTATSLCPR